MAVPLAEQLKPFFFQLSNNIDSNVLRTKR
jgi:hypothetical protein